MSCEQTHCSSHSFSVCKNHCMKQLCLEHLIEHEDFFLNQYENLLNQLEKSNNNLVNEINKINVKVVGCSFFSVRDFYHRLDCSTSTS